MYEHDGILEASGPSGLQSLGDPELCRIDRLVRLHADGVSGKQAISDYQRGLQALLPGLHEGRQVVILRYAFRVPSRRLHVPRDLHAEEAPKPADERP